MLPLSSHPVLHPDPADPGHAAVGAQAQAPAVALAAQGQGKEAAPAAAKVAKAVNAPPPFITWLDRLAGAGTRSGLRARLAQAVFAAAALGCMLAADGFRNVTAYRHLVAAASLQCLWSLTLAAMDVYSLVGNRSFRTTPAIIVYAIGDWVTGTLTLGAASGSLAITMILNDYMRVCSTKAYPRPMAAIALAFCTCFAIAPSFICHLTTAIYRVQTA